MDISDKYQVEFEFGVGLMIFDRVMPLEKNENFISDHYLTNLCTHSNQILYVDVFYEYTG